MSTRAPSFLLVGHVTSDEVGGRVRPGGAAYYGAIQARALGCTTRILTSSSPSWPGRDDLGGCQVAEKTSSSTCTFRYRQVSGERQSAVISRAAPLCPDDLPRGWSHSDVALICPILDEVDPSFAEEMAVGLLALAPQGWLRTLGSGGEVLAAPWDPPATLLPRTSLIFLSETDAPDAEARASSWSERGPAVVVTRAAHGYSLYRRSERIDLPALAAREVDPLGAGDCFAAATLTELAQGAHLEDALRFGAAAAAIAIEAPGSSGIRGRAAVLARLGSGTLGSSGGAI